MKRYEIYDIEWDTDDFSASKLGLPTSVFVEIDETAENYDEYDINEYINNYLSDKYDFCVFDWQKREVL